MASYSEKLLHNYYELTLSERVRYHLLTKHRWSTLERFFFEGSPTIPGQMYKAERELLFRTILHFKPRVCIEVGTYTGGGSTFFILNGLARLKQGILFSSETDNDLHQHAIQQYQSHHPDLFVHARFLLGENLEIFHKATNISSISFLLLDGAEDSEQTLNQFHFFNPKMKSGAILVAHDWLSEKTRLFKKDSLLQRQWQLLHVILPPQSVGMAIFRKL